MLMLQPLVEISGPAHFASVRVEQLAIRLRYNGMAAFSNLLKIPSALSSRGAGNITICWLP